MNDVLNDLKSRENSKSRDGMSRFGINPEKAFGISVKYLRELGKKIGKNHKLALELWETGFHEARILATIIDEPNKASKSQFNKWINDVNSWDLCDQLCNNLLVKTVYAYDLAFEWSISKTEFKKRAGFTLFAVIAVHWKHLEDLDFIKVFPRIIDEATDDRNFVKKAVNWALRQIGKRNSNLNKLAVETAEVLTSSENKSAKWIGKDALKELTDKNVFIRLKENG
ncbi:MAG: DNA alkylation repair protein [Melioribacteraceae bacterium]|nr:DNA alkylation repair protein [Melioribacteraceae bacterium]